MKSLKKILEYIETKKITKGNSSWWTEKGDTNISIEKLFEIRRKIREEIGVLNSMSELEIFFECKIARRHGIDVQIENFLHLIRNRNDPYCDLKTSYREIEIYMGIFVRSLVRDYNLPASIYVILEVVNEGGDYYSPSQKINFEVLEEIN